MRISPKTWRLASKNPYLTYLLRANRTLENAQRELKWIKQELPITEWLPAVKRRNKLEPLQYILGSQPFGSLSIQCRPNVLIPRPETEEWALRACEIIENNCTNVESLKILDACTGSGCIALLIKSKLNCEVMAIDISEDAVNLARANSRLHSLDITVLKHDLKDKFPIDQPLDIILSNPPYIPMEDYKKPLQLNGVEKSVKIYEPKLALVGENEFYEMLINNYVLPSKSKAFIFEIGYIKQAQFVAELLPDWKVGMSNDYNANPRCVIGWKNIDLSGMCDIMINE